MKESHFKYLVKTNSDFRGSVFEWMKNKGLLKSKESLIRSLDTLLTNRNKYNVFHINGMQIIFNKGSIDSLNEQERVELAERTNEIYKIIIKKSDSEKDKLIRDYELQLKELL